MFNRGPGISLPELFDLIKTMDVLAAFIRIGSLLSMLCRGTGPSHAVPVRSAAAVKFAFELFRLLAITVVLPALMNHGVDESPC